MNLADLDITFKTAICHTVSVSRDYDFHHYFIWSNRTAASHEIFSRDYQEQQTFESSDGKRFL